MGARGRWEQGEGDDSKGGWEQGEMGARGKKMGARRDWSRGEEDGSKGREMGARRVGLVCWSLTSPCHSNGHIDTMPAREINPFTALTRIRSQFLRTQ